MIYKYRIALLMLTSLSLFGCKPPEQLEIYTGYIEAEYLYIAPPSSGWLVQQSLQQGQKIHQGDLLFKLDDDQQQLQLNEAKLQLEQSNSKLDDMTQGARPQEIAVIENQIKEAQAQLKFSALEKERFIKTADKQLSTLSQRDQAISHYEVAKARLAELENQLHLAKLSAREHQLLAQGSAVKAAESNVAIKQWAIDQRSVFSQQDGIIDQVFYRKGEFVQQATPVISLLLDESLKVKFYLPQSKLSQIKLSHTVNIHSDGIPNLVQAKISHIAKDAEFTPPVLFSQNTRNKLVFLVEAKLPPSTRLNPGQPVDVSL
ncbi:MAG: integrase [Gammaproteobacteria bacterium CG22_combo_CG10-13_8_21_14_all_40_8]|nr:MAG: integrase [Gammaproteobacteria bacterium CG22_combo_CG10-13_8_21_14_all_40_8]